MKKTFVAMTLALITVFGATFANAGIIVGDRANRGGTATCEQTDGIIVGDGASTGIIVGDLANTGIIVGDFANTGIIVGDFAGIIVGDLADTSCTGSIGGSIGTERTGIIVGD